MTGGVTLHAAAAWRTEVIASGRLTSGTLAGLYRSLWLISYCVYRLLVKLASTLRAHRGRAAGRSAATTEANRCEHHCVRQATRPQKILWPSRHPSTKYLQCGKLRPMGIVGPVDNSMSRDSDRFLAAGAVTQSDRLEIELVQRPDTPAAILIKWPPQPTVTDPAKLTATIAAIVRVLGTAQIELAARRASGKLKRRRQTHEVVLRRS